MTCRAATNGHLLALLRRAEAARADGCDDGAAVHETVNVVYLRRAAAVTVQAAGIVERARGLLRRALARSRT